MTNIQSFSEVRSLDVTWWLTLSDLGPKFSQSVREICMNICAKNGGAQRRRFPAICEKPEGGVQTPLPASARVKDPLRVILVPLSNAAILKVPTWWLFLNIHCAYFDKKVAGSGQIRSPEAVCWPHLRKACNHARASVFNWSISCLQLLVRVPVCAICLSHNCRICDLRSDQIRDLYIASLWENIEMPPASCKRVKTHNYFSIMDDYLIGDDSGAAYWQGHRERSSEVMWRHKSFFINKSRHDGAKDL